MNPRYPIFVPSKGRSETPFTIRSFQKIGVPFSVVVEPQERNQYLKLVEPRQLILLPFSNRGLVATRNWIWDRAKSLGVKRFWTFDDNIDGLFRWNRNLKVPMSSGSSIAAIEDFVDRYENIEVAGMNYFMFASRKSKSPPLVFNTRIYSNMLLRSASPFRNRGVYNDDTDLCLQVLKAGFCTVQFNAFLIRKKQTMTVKGGMTPLYQGDGRRKMAEELMFRWPGLVRIAWKWGRWQHQVNYRLFRKNKLILRKDAKIPKVPNEYGMKLRKIHVANSKLVE